jgi:hypothetical protein
MTRPVGGDEACSIVDARQQACSQHWHVHCGWIGREPWVFATVCGVHSSSSRSMSSSVEREVGQLLAGEQAALLAQQQVSEVYICTRRKASGNG